jgi:dipeptidyl aminopeptidase/acylaminoacyl peptidase
MNALWQWVISRGVVLVAPNPRGTKGLGAAFHDLHDGDWGGVEFSDVMGVLDLIAELPYVDFHRKATWGGSGGGYMSFLIATRAPQVFDAQVIRAPVSAWKWIAMDRFTGQARYATATRDPQRAREEMGGSYTEIPDRYEERSPLNFVEHVTVPQLLLSARRDGSVPLNESRRWVARMKELGKGDLVDYVEYPDDDHSLLRYRSTMRDQGERIVKFLAEHLDAPQIAEEKVS